MVSLSFLLAWWWMLSQQCSTSATNGDNGKVPTFTDSSVSESCPRKGSEIAWQQFKPPINTWRCRSPVFPTASNPFGVVTRLSQKPHCQIAWRTFLSTMHGWRRRHSLAKLGFPTQAPSTSKWKYTSADLSPQHIRRNSLSHSHYECPQSHQLLPLHGTARSYRAFQSDSLKSQVCNRIRT